MGLLNRLQAMVPDFRGIPAGPARPLTRRPRPGTDERVPSDPPGGLGGRYWLLPYADRTTTGDTPDVRAAMRLMERDAWVKAGWWTQVLGVMSQDFQVHPDADRPKDPQAQEQAKFVRRCLEGADGEMAGLVGAVLSALGSDGFSLCEKVWAVEERRPQDKGRVVLKTLKPKDPERDVRLLVDEHRNVTGVTAVRTNQTFPLTDFTYARYLHKFDEPAGMAPYRAAYGAYWMRDTVRKLRAVHVEKKSAGMLVGEYDDPADKPELQRALAKAKNDTWMVVPAGAKVRAEAISTASEPDFKSFDESLREEILVGVAFAHLHILQGASSDQGNTAVHKSVADLGPWLLTYLAQTVFNRQVIPDLIDYNFPAPAGGYPRLTFGGVTTEEILDQFKIIEAAQRAGFIPSKSYYAANLTIQEADPADPADRLAPPQPPPGAGGFPPPGGGFGGGGTGFGSFVDRPPADAAPYGYCPECREPGVMRERRVDGNDRCRSGHVYPSDAAKFGYVGLPLAGPAADRLLALGRMVPDADLADDGREADPHVTVRYGLHGSDPGPVAAALRGAGPVRLTLGRLGAFYGADSGKPYDVIHAEVQSPELHALHARLGTLPHTDTHAEYRPHATVAYVRAGTADDLIRRMGGSVGLAATVGRVEFSDAARNATTIPLAGVAAPADREGGAGRPPATFPPGYGDPAGLLP